MSRVSATFEDVTSFTVPKDNYVLSCLKAEEDPEGTKPGAKRQGLILEWQVVAPNTPHNGKTIRFDRVNVKGHWDDGTEIVPYRLAELLMATKVPWSCLHETNGAPGSDITDRPAAIIKGTGDDGHEPGALYCSTCDKKVRVDFESSKLLGARIRAMVSVKPGNDGRDYNKIDRYLPLES